MWRIRDIKKINRKEHKILVAATPLGEDYMREGVILAKKRKEKSYIGICLYNKKELIGWSMLDFFLSKKSKYIRTYIYVKTKYRKMGYGKKIIKKTKEINKKMGNEGIKVCPHNKASLKFFKRININKKEVVRGYKY